MQSGVAEALPSGVSGSLAEGRARKGWLGRQLQPARQCFETKGAVKITESEKRHSPVQLLGKVPSVLTCLGLALCLHPSGCTPSSLSQMRVSDGGSVMREEKAAKGLVRAMVIDDPLRLAVGPRLSERSDYRFVL